MNCLACEDADKSMLEVLAARDWKRAVAGSGEAADAVVDAACRKMGKTPDQLPF